MNILVFFAENMQMLEPFPTIMYIIIVYNWYCKYLQWNNISPTRISQKNGGFPFQTATFWGPFWSWNTVGSLDARCLRQEAQVLVNSIGSWNKRNKEHIEKLHMTTHWHVTSTGKSMNTVDENRCLLYIYICVCMFVHPCWQTNPYSNDFKKGFKCSWCDVKPPYIQTGLDKGFLSPIASMYGIFTYIYHKHQPSM